MKQALRFAGILTILWGIVTFGPFAVDKAFPSDHLIGLIVGKRIDKEHNWLIVAQSWGTPPYKRFYCDVDKDQYSIIEIQDRVKVNSKACIDSTVNILTIKKDTINGKK